MAVSFGFYNSVGGDRRYDANQMSSLFEGLIQDGVFMTVGEAFAVTPGAGLTVNVATGRAWFNRTWTVNDTDLVLNIDIPEAVLNRIDAVVLEVDSADEVRANSIKIVKGTPATNPVRPTMANTTTLHQHPLAYVLVPAGLTQILASHITVMVGMSECPFVTGVISSMNLDELVARWESEFDQWFDNVRDQLSTDAAGNLQNQIDAINAAELTQEANISDLEAEIDALSAAGSAAGSGWAPTPDHWHPDSSGLPYNFIYTSLTGGRLKWPIGTKVRYEQPHALTAYFPFDGNASPAVGTYTVNNIGSPLYATFTNTVNGTTVTRQMIRFTGSSGIAVNGTLTPFKPVGDFSISFIITNPLSGNLTGTIFESGTWEDRYGIRVYIDANGYITFSIGDGSTAKTVKSKKTIAQMGADYTHIVCTFRKGMMCLYVDCLLDAYLASGVSAVSYNPTEHYVRFGCMVAATGGATHTSYLSANSYIDDFIFMNDVCIDRATIDQMYDKVIWVAFGNGPMNVTKFAITGAEMSNSNRAYLYQGTDYKLTTGNNTIPKVWYSTSQTPEYFPKDPSKWGYNILDTTRRAQATPVNGTWYSLQTITWPVDQYDFQPPNWNISIDLLLSVAGPAAGTEAWVGVYDYEGGNLLKAVNMFFPTASYRVPVHIEMPFSSKLPGVIAAKVATGSVTSLAFENAISAFNAKAVCAYL